MIWQIESLNTALLLRIATLVDRIEEKTFTVKDYISHIMEVYQDQGLFLLYLNEEIVAYLHACEPSPLNKKTGYIAICVGDPGIDRRWADELLHYAERWMYLHGAEQWYMDTTRNAKVWARRYKLDKINNEIQLGRSINV